MPSILPDEFVKASPEDLRESLEQFTLEDLYLLRWQMEWRAMARAKQIPPNDLSWNFYGIKSGRGFGKTLAAANWLGQAACRDADTINFVVAPTHDDLRYICFEGPTGLYQVIPAALIDDTNLTLPSITLKNGSILRGFAADTPDRLRGPQCHRAWCEEIASWRYPEKAWDNLLFGLRLGKHPQIMWTGTPRPKPFLRMLIKLAKSIIISGSTYENRENLTEIFYENVAKYEGTTIGRQELRGELLDPEEAGFVKRSDWRLWPRGRPLPKFRFIILSLDTAFTEKTWNKKDQKGDPTACTVWGLFEYERKEHVMLLDAWEDHLGFPALISRVKEERLMTYGDSEEPLIRPSLVNKMQRPRHQGRPPDIVLIEEKGSGISLIQSLAVENILAETYNPHGQDKLSRLHSASPLFSHGRVWAIESRIAKGEPRTWAEPVISQFCTYVGEGSLEHDDLLDTGTQALILFMHKFNIKFTNRISVEEQTKRALEQLKRKRISNPYDGRGRH
jgi:phage terminase large subunit-like protein